MQENICLEVICRSTVLTNKLSFERTDYISLKFLLEKRLLEKRKDYLYDRKEDF